MSSANVKDRTEKELAGILNAELAQLLRQHGLEAEAVQSSGRQHQIDLFVELGYEVVGIKAEFAPARPLPADRERLLADAPKRWRGLPLTGMFRIVYPEDLRRVPLSDAKEALARCETLEFERI